MRETSGSITHDVSVKRFGVPTRYVEYAVTVTDTPTEIAELNPRRLACTVINHSTDTVVVGFRPDYSIDEGILLAPNGGTVIFTVDEDGELVSSQIFARGVLAGGNVYVIQVVGV